MIDNTLSEFFWALRQITPAKAWWDSEPTHPAVARALHIDPADDGAVYAMTPFRYCVYDARHVILVAYPAPMIFEPDHAWFGIETVIAWHPNEDRAEVLGDDTAQLVGNLTDEANTIHSSPRAFFQAWAIRRAQYLIQRQQYAGKDWHLTPAERDLVPGVLMIGSPASIRWNPSAMPKNIEVVGTDPKELNRALIRAARLPSIVGRVA